MKRFFGMIVMVAFALLPAFKAQATTLAHDFGFIPAGGSASYFQTTGNAGPGALVPGQSFTDTYTFTAPLSQNLLLGANIVFAGTLSSLDLFNGLTHIASGTGTSTALSISLANLSYTTPYSLVTTGVAGSPFSGYTAAVAISSVPLPAALPLFGAGLLSLGFLVRRRRVHVT